MIQNHQQTHVRREADHRPLALVFRTDLLPLSETFIRDQVLAIQRWRTRLIGYQFVDGLELSNLRSELLSTYNLSPIPRVLRRVLRQFDLPPPGVRRYLQGLNASVAHVHFGTDLVALWPILNGLDMPILATLHGYDINIHPEVWQRSWRASRRYPERLRQISRDPRVKFVAVSEAIKQRAIEFGLAPDRVVVRHIGVDTQRFVPAKTPLQERPRRILYVGRMIEKKCPTILIDAFAEVRCHVPDAELVMIGDGPMLESCQARAAALRVPVQFLGAVAHGRVMQEMEHARVFCLPSITAASGDAEGLSIAILEAQSAGVPVVTSARGAKEAVEHGVTGYVFSELDLNALSKALTRVLRDDDVAAEMSVAARERTCRIFDLRTCTAKLEALYDQCADGWDQHPRAVMASRNDTAHDPASRML